VTGPVDKIRTRRVTRRQVLLALGIALTLAGLYVVPRAVALRGVSMTSHLRFIDMFYHLNRLDLMVKRNSLDPQQIADPYFARFPDQLEPLDFARWPKGVLHLAALWSGNFGPHSIWTTQLTNLVFTVILVVGVILLGRAMGGTRIGLWGAALVLLCPGLVAHSWYFSLDYPLIAMTIVGCYLLWETRGFTRPWACLALGLWSGLALFVKVSYVLYLAGPSVASLVLGLRRPAMRLRAAGLATGAIVLTLGLGFALTGGRPLQLWSELGFHLSDAVERTGLPFKLVEPWTVRWALTNAHFAVANFPWPLLLLALPGLLLAHVRSRPLPARWLLLTLFWATYLILTLMPNKMERYVQPLYPLLCLLSVWWVTVLIPRRWQTVGLLWITTTFGAVLWVAHLRPTPWLPEDSSHREVGWMHEIGMPGQEVLAGLRRKTYHQACQLAPLLKGMQALQGPGRHRRPLGVASWSTKTSPTRGRSPTTCSPYRP
jgi:hypothetical protein